MPNSLLWKFTDSSTHGVKIRNFYRAKVYDSSFKCRWRRLKRIFLHQDITVLSRLVRDFRKSGVSFFTYEKLLFLFFSHQKFLFKPSYISYRAPKQHIPSIIFQEKFPRTKQIFQLNSRLSQRKFQQLYTSVFGFSFICTNWFIAEQIVYLKICISYEILSHHNPRK